MAESLATIQKIEEILPIENADKIEVAKVMGWSVVVKKGEFKEGDLCVFIEIDSLVPRTDWSEFLFNPDKDNEYHHLKTVKLRKQISQGLVIPITTVENEHGNIFCSWDGNYYHPGIDDADTVKVEIGDDVTEYLGIKKYEKPQPNHGGPNKIKTRNFPFFLRKTDEVRIQSNLNLLEELKGKPYYITQKLDGTSFTCYKFKGKFGVCSRNLEIRNTNNPKGFFQHIWLEIKKLCGRSKKEISSRSLYWRMADKYKISEWLPEGYSIQGEIVGPGVQQNKMGLEENELYIFNVWDINKQKYINPMTPVEWSNLSKFVPDVEVNPQGKFNYTMEELLEIADKQKYPNNSPAEGIVVRSIDQEISFKVVSNKFMLKYGE